ncbi:MAG: TIGR03986 family CRISPR-associated RAMP protein [Chloroflexi bacterium]|nr:TIGR03986 family CRISPR-associated RAMP protein [Chloroflexota bacterium]
MSKRKAGKKRQPPPWKQKQKDARKKRRAEQRLKQEAKQARQEGAAPDQVTPKLPWPESRRSNVSWENYRFLNPYNFVRYLPEPTIPPGDPEAALLSRCPPPPHDRYVGLTGRITCRMKTESPLFVSDSHNVVPTPFIDESGKRRVHYSYRFFQVDGEDAIPATSLRGMIRSVFEAVTNSCFGVFTPEERLDYRQVDMAREMQAAIVTRIPQSEEDHGEVALCEDARIPAYTDNPRIDVNGWECGEIGYTILSESGKTVVEWGSVYDTDERPITEGWVKITGRTIPGKKHERFFYFPEGKQKAPKAIFDWERMQDYNAVLEGQIKDETRAFKTYYQHRNLAVGDLVYVRLSDNKKDILDISLVKVPRLKFRKSLADLLPSHLHPCERYDELCPACRSFGWVKGAHRRESATEDKEERIAYAGRVRFSFGKLVEDKGVYDEVLPLAILSTPKPTTALFYLLKGDPEAPEGEPPQRDQEIGYTDGYKLRGRKFYRHYGRQLNRQEFERAGRKQDHQNRSVRGVRTPGNIFEFTVDFENLAPLELGALLWSLDLDGRGFHRLGYGKPLGFGSVQVSIEQVEILDWERRLQSFDSKAGWQQPTALETGKWIASFVEAMERVYGTPLDRLEHIHDLLALAAEPANDLPIHYPRTDVSPHPEGKNFEWFEENTRKAKKVEEAGPHHALALACEDYEGLPLLKPPKG